MLQVTVVAMGRCRENYLLQAFREYEKRLRTACKFSLIELEECRLPQEPSEGEIRRALEQEAKLILAKLPPRACCIPLCIEGRQQTSTQLAELMRRIAQEGGQVAFVIGSSHGLADEVKARGRMQLSMSAMTFPHQLARVMLVEQIYRALSIGSNGKYHK